MWEFDDKFEVLKFQRLVLKFFDLLPRGIKLTRGRGKGVEKIPRSEIGAKI